MQIAIIIILAVLLIVVSTLWVLIINKIVVTYFFKIIGDYTEKMLEMIMDLIFWAKGSGKQK